MRKIDGQRYLFQRNETYYFRKAIEEKYWPYFNNKQEIKKSLRTSNLREAINRLCRELNEHNYAIEAAKQKIFPTIPSTQNFTPEELQRIARTWFLSKNRRIDIRNAAKNGKRKELGQQLKAEITMLEDAFISKEAIPLYTTWVADHLIEEHSLAFQKGGEEYQKFLDIITRAQLEFARRANDELHARLSVVE
jgi:hypothetical protein